jgi:hypothetical protein
MTLNLLFRNPSIRLVNAIVHSNKKLFEFQDNLRLLMTSSDSNFFIFNLWPINIILILNRLLMFLTFHLNGKVDWLRRRTRVTCGACVPASVVSRLQNCSRRSRCLRHSYRLHTLLHLHCLHRLRYLNIWLALLMRLAWHR